VPGPGLDRHRGIGCADVRASSAISSPPMRQVAVAVWAPRA
jgi:hypothetical protein